MKKLVFLHGSGSNKNAYNDLMRMIAHHYNADLLSFDAPFQHSDKPNKYKWFNKFENDGRRDAIAEEYRHPYQNHILFCENFLECIFGAWTFKSV